MEYNGKIENKDITNSIPYEELTDEDMNTMTNNLMQNEGIQKISELIFSYLKSYDSNNCLYYDNYDL